MQSASKVDVVVIGAGIAGLTCAQQLAQAGLRVVVLEKARGVGGRVATRRLHGTHADHGACYLSPKGEIFQQFVQELLASGVIHAWVKAVPEMKADGSWQVPALEEQYPRYVAPAGMTAIAKTLTTGLDIRLSHRVHTVSYGDTTWHLTAECTAEDTKETVEFLATALLVAIPAPQAVTLLKPLTPLLTPEWITKLESVQFFPCLSVIAGYDAKFQIDWLQQFPHLKATTFARHPDLGWLGLDSSKRDVNCAQEASQSVFVVQSTAAYAERYLDAIDLIPAGKILLKAAAAQLTAWLAVPDWMQVHRWRYAFAQTPLSETFLAASTPAPLVCAGDWCGGSKIEAALLSGLAAADHLLTYTKTP